MREVPVSSDEGNWPVKRVTWGERLNRRQQVNRLKQQSSDVRGRARVRLHGLKYCRLAAGLTQRELAQKIGANQWTIAQLENDGWRGANMVTIRRLCRALKVMPADLICREPIE
jgi:DNA-binding XRE family transcriptional regulator